MGHDLFERVILQRTKLSEFDLAVIIYAVRGFDAYILAVDPAPVSLGNERDYILAAIDHAFTQSMINTTHYIDDPKSKYYDLYFEVAYKVGLLRVEQVTALFYFILGAFAAWDQSHSPLAIIAVGEPSHALPFPYHKGTGRHELNTNISS